MMRMFQQRSTWVALLLGVLVAVTFLAPIDRAWTQDDDFEERARTLFREGMEAWERGNLDEAYTKLERCLELKPHESLLFALVEEVSYAKLFKGISQRGESDDKRKIADTFMRILELSKPAAEHIRKDQDTILGYVEDLKGEDYDTVHIAMNHLTNVGPYAIPHLIPVLRDQQNDRFRNNVIRTLVRMHDRAVNALIETLNSSDPFQRQNAAYCLELIRDERAIPALKAVFENPDEINDVKLRATEALLKISNKAPDDLKSAKEYFYLLAEKYYYAHPSVMLTYFLDYFVWEWDEDGDALVYHEVPAFAYNEILAEEACMDGLALDPNYEPLWSLLACSQYAYVARAWDAIENGKLQIKMGYTNVEDLAKIEKQLGRWQVGDVVGRLVGKKWTYHALNRSLQDDTPLVSVAAIEALRQMSQPDDFAPVPVPTENGKTDPNAPVIDPASYVGTPLIDAMSNRDKRVRYHAASVMADVNPQDARVGMELVMLNLVDALGEQGQRVVLVIVEPQQLKDKEFIHKMRAKLRFHNCQPVFADSARDGVLKAKAFPSADLIIIEHDIANQVYFATEYMDGRRQVKESVFDTIRDDVRLSNVPIYILTDGDDQMEQAKTIYLDRAQDYIDRSIDKLELGAHLEKSFAAPEAQKDSKDRADAMAKLAAETLRDIDPTNTLYPYMDAIPAMIKTLALETPREDFIRIPVIDGLGTYGATNAIDVLAATLNEWSANSAEVRLHTARAMASIYKLNPSEAPNEEVFRILKRNLYQQDPENHKAGPEEIDLQIEIAVGEALANANLSAEQRYELARWKRQHDVGNWDQ